MAMRRRGKVASVGTLVILIAGAVTGIFLYLRPLPSIKPTLKPLTPTTAQAMQLSWPSSGEAAIGASHFGILATSGDQVPKPTASTAKVITALAVLQKYPLNPGQQGPTITLGPSDVALYEQYASEDGSVAQVTAGETITEYQVLEAMMLPSANNLADSLAIWAFGSLPAYTTYANQFVKTLSMTHTTIGSDASGFQPDTVSTAGDLVQLALAALNDPVLTQIVGQQTATIPVAGTIHNVDTLIGQDGIIGIKTGNSDQAGGVFIFGAQDQLDSAHNLTLVGAVQGLGTIGDALASTKPLLDSVKTAFTVYTPVKAAQVMGSYQLPWGGSVPVVAKQAISTVVWNGTSTTPNTAMEEITATLPKGHTVGAITLTSNGTTQKTDLILGSNVPSPPWYWRITHRQI